MPGAKENTRHPGEKSLQSAAPNRCSGIARYRTRVGESRFFARDICIKRLYKTAEVSALSRYRYLSKSLALALALARRDTVARFARVFV
jgi:hypothetical protein